MKRQAAGQLWWRVSLSLSECSSGLGTTTSYLCEAGAHQKHISKQIFNWQGNSAAAMQRPRSGSIPSTNSQSWVEFWQKEREKEREEKDICWMKSHYNRICGCYNYIKVIWRRNRGVFFITDTVMIYSSILLRVSLTLKTSSKQYLFRKKKYEEKKMGKGELGGTGQQQHCRHEELQAWGPGVKS